MKNYKVTFIVFHEDNKKEYRTIIVEAGTKKMATLRAMKKINDDYPEIANLYKSVKSVEEAA